MSHDKNPDLGAAFAGLIGGSIFIGAILYGIVVLTNRSFKSEGGEAKHGAAIAAAVRHVA
jgi:hypothetical protein